jgi:DNA-binding transcriptional ArsR family regulator
MIEDEKILQELERILTALKHPTRLKIVQVLLNAERPLSFIEIRERLNNGYEKDEVWFHLKILVRNNVVKTIRGKVLEKNPGPGRPKTIFYTLHLTEEGKIAIDYLNEFMKTIREHQSKNKPRKLR